MRPGSSTLCLHAGRHAEHARRDNNAQMLWSFARCGYNDEALLQVMHDISERLASSCDRCATRTRHFTAAGSTVAPCTIPPPPRAHAAHLSPPPQKNMQTLRSTTLADVVQAEARMGWADQRLADLVAGHAEARMAGLDATHLAELMAGLASVGCGRIACVLRVLAGHCRHLNTYAAAIRMTVALQHANHMRVIPCFLQL